MGISRKSNTKPKENYASCAGNVLRIVVSMTSKLVFENVEAEKLGWQMAVS